MQRTIVQPPVPGDAALAELKHWLGISRPNDDETLEQLLLASLTICEAFTGKTPLQQTVEEIIPLAGGWQELVSRPVREVSGAALIAADGTREVIAQRNGAIEGVFRIDHAKGHGAGARPVLSSKVPGQAFGLAVDDEIDVALAEEHHVFGAVLRHQSEPHFLEQRLQRVGNRRGELDELEATQTHGVVKQIGHENLQ